MPENRWLTPTDLYKEFDISQSTQKTLRKNNILKYSKIGNKIFYDRTILNNILENHQVN